MSEAPWRVALTGQARRDLSRLPEKAAAAVIEAIEALARNPNRMGKRLRHELEGLWVARRGPYRVIYEMDEEERRLTVVALGHRSDVYRQR